MVKRVESIYVFLVDNAAGDEGIVATQAGRRLEPMIASSEDKLEQLRGLATELVQRSGRRIRLVRFTTREDLQEITFDGDQVVAVES